MQKKKIMPCLDIKDGRVVKGIKFTNLRDAGDPVECSRAYLEAGADELVFLDITATVEKRKTVIDSVKKVAEVTSIPFTVGGGISSLQDAEEILFAGADRISLGSAALQSPQLINELAEKFGSDRLVVAMDVDYDENQPSGYQVFMDAGKTATGLDALSWAKEAVERGAGIILPTSKACDGAKEGYDLSLISLLKRNLLAPVVASGGAGKMEHFKAAAQAGADYLLAASVFHFGEIGIYELKLYLDRKGIEVML